MVTTKEKYLADRQKIMKKELKHTATKVTRSQKKAARNEQEQRSTKQSETKDKMAVVSPYLLISTLNINGLNSPTKSQRMAKWIEKQGKVNNMLLYKRLTLASSIQTESEGMEKGISSKW